MRKTYLFLLIIVVLFLSACQSSEQIKPLKEETIGFDINTAIEIVKKKENMIIDLSLRDEVSQLEYEELEHSFTDEFGRFANDILSILFINNMDADPESHKYVQKNTLYPTVFHEGISITSSVIYNSYYENDFLNQTRLTIREEYIGDNENLNDWYREYIFTPNKNEEWELTGFSGVMNFLGDNYNMNYLELNR